MGQRSVECDGCEATNAHREIAYAKRGWSGGRGSIIKVIGRRVVSWRESRCVKWKWKWNAIDDARLSQLVGAQGLPVSCRSGLTIRGLTSGIGSLLILTSVE